MKQICVCLFVWLAVTPFAQQPSARETAARAPIDAFFKAFNARDNDALKKTLNYPHVRINEAGGVNGRMVQVAGGLAALISLRPASEQARIVRLATRRVPEVIRAPAE